MIKKVKYTGEGGEIFYDYNWAPKPGEVREVELADDADLTDHPSLELTDEPETLVTETEIASGQAEDVAEEGGVEDPNPKVESDNTVKEDVANEF